MAQLAKFLSSTAGVASGGGAGLDVDDCFSCFLYTGNGTAGRTITNNIDISTEGGLIWTKSRSSTYNHTLGDTANGVNKYLYSNTTADIDTSSAYYSAFNTNGYVIGDAAQGFNANELNANSVDYVSWTFRKAPKFFDCVQYSGSSSAQTISHSLDAVPAVIIVKQLNSSGRWTVYHKDASPTGNPQNGRLALNTTDQWYEYPAISSFANLWNQTAPTSTHFTVGTDATTGASGSTYVAYLFSHHANDGSATGFGPNGDSPCISVGSYSGNGSDNGPTVDCGFEPQFILSKRSDSTSQWTIVDTMRGSVTGGSDVRLYPNLINADDPFDFIEVTPTGFKLASSASAYNASGGTYIYLAVRRGSLNVPDDPTKVFAPVNHPNDASDVLVSPGFTTDMVLTSKRAEASNRYIASRLTGAKVLKTNDTTAESGDYSQYMEFDHQNGVFWKDLWGNQSAIDYHFKRAPSFFDCIAYLGSGSARDLSHNLSAIPSMYWIKARDESRGWIVYANIGGTYKELSLNGTGAAANASSIGGDPTASVIKLGTSYNENRSGYNYIAYLFASCPGISKVGSCSHTFGGGDTNVDCGFSNGCRFLLIKSTTHAYPWEVYDSVRGIVSGNDPYLKLNNTDAEVTNNDGIDPLSSGFTLTSTGWNTGTYIFYAIA